MTWLIVGSILAVLATGGHLLTRGWPLVPKLLFATGLLIAAPTLVAQGVLGTAWAMEQLSPVSGPLAWGVLLLPAVVVAGLLTLLRDVPWLDIGRLPLGLAMAALVLFAVVTAPLLVLGIGLGEPQKAEHTWQARIEPGEDDQAYTVELPFLVADAAADEPLLDRFRERVTVAEGQGDVELVRDGAWLRVEATGPLTVTAQDAYYGSIGDREALTSLVVPAGNATLEAAGDLSLSIEITFSFSGGSGHTCWSDGRIVGQAPGPGAFPLRLIDHGDEQVLWREETGLLPTVCA